MTIETILTDAEIIALGKQARAIEAGENGYILPVKFARAIEQAVLQSEQVQAWKRGADLLDRLADPTSEMVEALEDIGASWHGVNTELERYMRNVARLALAAHRKQGGEA